MIGKIPAIFIGRVQVVGVADALAVEVVVEKLLVSAAEGAFHQDFAGGKVRVNGAVGFCDALAVAIVGVGDGTWSGLAV